MPVFNRRRQVHGMHHWKMHQANVVEVKQELIGLVTYIKPDPRTVSRLKKTAAALTCRGTGGNTR